MITIIAGGVIVALGGAILIWWMTNRLKAGRGRTFLRLVTLPLLVVLVAAASLYMVRAQSQLLPESTPLLAASESMNVQMGTLTQTLSSTGSLATADQKTLTFATSAPVTQVLVSEGDTVKAGDVLATVDSTSVDAQIRDAQTNLQSAQNALTALQAPPSDLDLKSAQLSVDAAEASLSGASQTGSSDTDIQIAALQAELAKNQLWQQQLSSGGSNPNQPNAYANSVMTAASLAQAESNVTAQEMSATEVANTGPDASQLSSANAQLTSAQANLDALTTGASDSQIRQAQINVETAQLALDEAETLRDNTQIVAPFDEIVAAVDLAVGEMPGAGSITLLDTSHYTITLSVDEKDITQLAVGQQVNVTVEALNNAAVTGTVTQVDPTPASTSNLVTYDVDVTLDGASVALRPGMTAIANVILNQVNNVIVIPNRFISTNAATGESSVEVETGTGSYAAVPVTLGATTDSESVVTNGLNVGETIVVLSSGTSGTSTQQRSGLGLLGGGALGGGGAPPGEFGGGGGFTRGSGGRGG